MHTHTYTTHACTCLQTHTELYRHIYTLAYTYTNPQTRTITVINMTDKREVHVCVREVVSCPPSTVMKLYKGTSVHLVPYI